MAVLDSLLGYYNDKDLGLGRFLRRELAITDPDQAITEKDLNAYIQKQYTNLSDDSFERDFVVVKLYTLIHHLSIPAYKLAPTHIAAITNDLLDLLAQKDATIRDSYEAIPYTDPEARSNLLFKKLRDITVLSKEELTVFYNKRVAGLYKDADSRKKIENINNGLIAKKPEDGLKKGIAAIGASFEQALRATAYSADASLPLDRALQEKDFIIDPNSNDYKKMLSDNLRLQLIQNVRLLEKMQPKADKSGVVRFTGEQLFKKFNAAIRKLCLDYRNNINRESFDANIKIIVTKLAALLRYNNRIEAANDLLAAIELDPSLRDDGATIGYARLFRSAKNGEPTLFSPETVAAKTAEFMAKIKTKFTRHGSLLRGNDKDFNPQIRAHIQNQPLLPLVDGAMQGLDANPDMEEPRRRLFNRLVKLRLALNNYEIVDTAIADAGGADILPDVLPMNYLFEQFKQQYDSLTERLDTEVRPGKPKKYLDMVEVEEQRKAELANLTAEIQTMHTNVQRRNGVFVRAKQELERKGLDVNNLDEIEDIESKLVKIKQLLDKLTDVDMLVAEGTGVALTKSKKIFAKCTELFAEISATSEYKAAKTKMKV